MTNRHSVILGAIAAINMGLVLALGYMFFSEQDSLTERIAKIESSSTNRQEKTQDNSLSNDKKISELASDLDAIKEKIGVTSAELKHTRDTAQALKRQQDQVTKQIADQLAAKANSSDIDGLRNETTAKLAEASQDSNTKLGNVSGEVTSLKQDLVASRDDWGRQLVEVKNALNERIAKNSGELAELRKKGERDYFEFDIRKNSKQPFSKVADIQLAVLKTDPKNHKFNVAIQVDDSRLDKKDRTANEPIQFLVGRDQLRYEVVVNSVEKDRIRGYVSAPKDKVLAAEAPRLRLQ